MGIKDRNEMTTIKEEQVERGRGVIIIIIIIVISRIYLLR
jgi:hypothetical protein